MEIKKLDEAVINKIAAGEVIQRPANALKELIENSLDAKSTDIQITVKNGGLKLIEIQDNGTGIRREDFGIVCERFTTSKLRNFTDLENISTYGFRGEALASISHVAHLSIISRTINDVFAYKANFVNGEIKGAPVRTAGNVGTMITIEDLFFNMKVRRTSLRSPAEEYRKITEVVGKYAIHNGSVGFALRKSNGNNDIRTPSESNTLNNIRTIYGNVIARETIEFALENDQYQFKANGYITNVNYSTKRFNFLLFINNRLVDCPNLKKCIDQVYSTYLPKNAHPFVYLCLEIDPANVDVNVHPTKHEVHFLNEEKIVEVVCAAIEVKLLGSNNSRVFYTQAKLPGIPPNHPSDKDSTSNDAKKVNPKDLVRTDATEQKLDKFFGSQTDGIRKVKTIVKNVDRVEVQLTSVTQIRGKIDSNCHRILRDLFSQHVFVGSISPDQVLIQFSTKLFLCDNRKILNELIYQMIFKNFQNIPYLRLETKLSVFELALIGLNSDETGWTSEDGDKNDLARKVTDVLNDKKEMLNEYFSLEINDNGELVSLPLIIDNYLPDFGLLPVFIVRFATEVNWDSEKDCFHTFAKEIALYYSRFSKHSKSIDGNDWKWVSEHIFYSLIKEFFLPPKTFTENAAILETADLPNLYKVFERC